MSRHRLFDGLISYSLELLDASFWKRGDRRGEMNDGVGLKVDEDEGDIKDGAGTLGAVDESNGALVILTGRPSGCVS
jgi:hypothetical protein